MSEHSSQPHKFVPSSHSPSGSVTCGFNYQFTESSGAFCGEPPDHPIHTAESGKAE